MAVHFECADSKSLLRAFDERVVQTEPRGRIATWEKHADGIHYTHRAADWARKAWFKAQAVEGRLTFFIIRSKDSNMATRTYAYYHGHLVETFLAHFDGQFSSAYVTALPIPGDVVKAQG